MKPHNIMFTDAQWRAVCSIADKTGLKAAQVVRNAVERLAKVELRQKKEKPMTVFPPVLEMTKQDEETLSALLAMSSADGLVYLNGYTQIDGKLYGPAKTITAQS